MEVVASLSQGRTAAAQCGMFTHKSVPVIFEPPCILDPVTAMFSKAENSCLSSLLTTWNSLPRNSDSCSDIQVLLFMSCKTRNFLPVLTTADTRYMCNEMEILSFKKILTCIEFRHPGNSDCSSSRLWAG